MRRSAKGPKNTVLAPSRNRRPSSLLAGTTVYSAASALSAATARFLAVRISTRNCTSEPHPRDLIDDDRDQQPKSGRPSALRYRSSRASASSWRSVISGIVRPQVCRLLWPPDQPPAIRRASVRAFAQPSESHRGVQLVRRDQAAHAQFLDRVASPKVRLEGAIIDLRRGDEAMLPALGARGGVAVQ